MKIKLSDSYILDIEADAMRATLEGPQGLEELDLKSLWRLRRELLCLQNAWAASAYGGLDERAARYFFVSMQDVPVVEVRSTIFEDCASGVLELHIVAILEDSWEDDNYDSLEWSEQVMKGISGCDEIGDVWVWEIENAPRIRISFCNREKLVYSGYSMEEYQSWTAEDFEDE